MSKAEERNGCLNNIKEGLFSSAAILRSAALLLKPLVNEIDENIKIKAFVLLPIIGDVLRALSRFPPGECKTYKSELAKGSNVRVCAAIEAAYLLIEKFLSIYCYLEKRGNKAYVFTVQYFLSPYFLKIRRLGTYQLYLTEITEKAKKYTLQTDDNDLIHAILDDLCTERVSVAESQSIEKRQPIQYYTDDAYSPSSEHENIITNCSSFLIEVGSASLKLAERPLMISDTNPFTNHYEIYFIHQKHINFVNTSLPCVISVLLNEKKINSDFDITILARFSHGTFFIEHSETNAKRIPQGVEIFRYVKKYFSNLNVADFKCVFSSENTQLSTKLLSFDDSNVTRHMKFGILYQKDYQGDFEDEMYNNTKTSQKYDEFLDFIGDRISLLNWPYFRGGLDVQGGGTGTHSVYTQFSGIEIMFHVATLLPFMKNEEQQIERKRHLGNDIVLVVFQESDAPFNPSCTKSNFNHVFIIVRVDTFETENDPQKVTHYNVYVTQKSEVKPFPPRFVRNYSFRKDNYFREFLLTKLINAEIASMKSPNFAKKMEKTRQFSLSSIL